MSLKVKILRYSSFINTFFLRLKGVEMGQNTYLLGIPFIKIKKGTRIIIGDNCALTSTPRFHPPVTQRVMLCTNTTGAEIILHNGVGISGSTLDCSARIELGENTIIGHGSLLIDSDAHAPGPHQTWLGTIGQVGCGKPITIGRGCFVGARSIILKGVTIGDGCVTAAASDINLDVPDEHVGCGNHQQMRPAPESLKNQAPSEGERDTAPPKGQSGRSATTTSCLAFVRGRQP